MHHELLKIIKENYKNINFKLELFDYNIESNNFMSKQIMKDINLNYNTVYKIELPKIKIIIKTHSLNQKIKKDIQLILNH